MKKVFAVLLVCILCLTGCSFDDSPDDNSSSADTLSNQYNIGDEVELGAVRFNIYKIDEVNNELYLLAQSNIATTAFSDDERSYKYQHDYEGSLVEAYVRKFVHDLEDKGYVIKSSGIIDKDDLYELGFKHSDGLSGRPYLVDSAPEFVKYENMYWVAGYCEYETMSWAYSFGQLDSEPCEDEYGVRPVIIIEPSEIDKQPFAVDPNLSIQSLVSSDSVWVSEGGIHNPYDQFYFDCENMLFINTFESSELSETYQYNMEFIDEKTILIEGFTKWYQIPAKLTIVNENKLRLRFVDDTYNDGDYFLIRETE